MAKIERFCDGIKAKRFFIQKEDMHMDSDYKAFRNYLKGMDKTSLLKLCRLAGFEDRELEIIIQFFGSGRNEDYIADLLNMSVDSYHKVKRKQIRRLQHFCHQIYRPEVTPYAERMRILDEYLMQN